MGAPPRTTPRVQVPRSRTRSSGFPPQNPSPPGQVVRDTPATTAPDLSHVYQRRRAMPSDMAAVEPVRVDRDRRREATGEEMRSLKSIVDTLSFHRVREVSKMRLSAVTAVTALLASTFLLSGEVFAQDNIRHIPLQRNSVESVPRHDFSGRFDGDLSILQSPVGPITIDNPSGTVLVTSAIGHGIRDFPSLATSVSSVSARRLRLTTRLMAVRGHNLSRTPARSRPPSPWAAQPMSVLS